MGADQLRQRAFEVAGGIEPDVADHLGARVLECSAQRVSRLGVVPTAKGYVDPVLYTRDAFKLRRINRVILEWPSQTSDFLRIENITVAALAVA